MGDEICSGFWNMCACAKCRADDRLLEQASPEVRAQATIAFLLHKGVPTAPDGYYECGEGYAHLIGTACTGQCVLRS